MSLSSIVSRISILENNLETANRDRTEIKIELKELQESLNNVSMNVIKLTANVDNLTENLANHRKANENQKKQLSRWEITIISSLVSGLAASIVSAMVVIFVR